MNVTKPQLTAIATVTVLAIGTAVTTRILFTDAAPLLFLVFTTAVLLVGGLVVTIGQHRAPTPRPIRLHTTSAQIACEATEHPARAAHTRGTR